MPITKNSELQATVLTWMARDDIAVNVQDCITLAEAYFNRRLRVRQQESIVPGLTLTNGETNLPDDYLAWRRLTWEGDPENDLDFVAPGALFRLYPTAHEGTPQKFTIEGRLLRVRPIGEGSYTVNYFAKIPPLVGADDTNWLLIEYPDAYLAGTLAWVNTLVQNQEQFQIWITACDQILQRTLDLSEKTKAPSAIMVDGPTP
jgi:hypothetical protein